jgi:small subunit ribosomal protein S3Ae
VPVVETRSLIGRRVRVNLMTIVSDMKRQNIDISFLISSIKADTAFTDFFGYYLNPSSVKRLIRRGKEKINLSVVCRTADNKPIRIKPLIIPFSSVQNSVATAYRKESTNFLGSYCAKTTFENIIRDLIAGKLQKDMKGVLKKIHPIRILEISKLYIETEKNASESKIIKVVEKENKEPGEEAKKTEEEETTKETPQVPEEKERSNEELSEGAKETAQTAE